MQRTASGDAVFQAFDQAIESYLTKNRQAIEKEFRAAAGRPVQDSEVDSFIQGLGDSLYETVQPDPAHVKRFVDFYVSPDKLQKAVTTAIEGAVAYSPGRAAADLVAIADALDRAKAPSATKLMAALDRVASRL